MTVERTPFLHSLSVRLLIPLFLAVGVVLTLHAVFSFRSTTDHFLRFVEADIERYSELIKRATRDGMLLNSKDEVQSTIYRLAEGPELASIRVYDLEGTIVMSAQRAEIGQQVKKDSEACQSCHCVGESRSSTALIRRNLVRVANGQEVLRHLSVIKNEHSCATASCHAHPKRQTALGVLEVEMSMIPLEESIGTAKRQFLWTTLILILIVGVVAALFVKRLVHRPIIQLTEGTRRIAGGDLDTRIVPQGRHELARLAEAFNNMAADLSAARREITEWSQQLEKKVVAKTEELSRAQRQVLHMEKMASLGKLSATVAHEINNPISGILTYARLVRRELAEQPLDKDIREEWSKYLRIIEDECRRCGGIVQNLLLFSRPTRVALDSVDVNDVVNRSLVLVRHHLEMGGVTVHCELLNGQSTITANAEELHQALVALFVNAAEAMSGLGRNERELSVRLHGLADHIQIDVADTGPGIPPEVLPHIFEPFFSTKEDQKGVGLGLAVVYGIVERHGGQVHVTSQVGQGTVFEIRLPRNPKVSEETAPKDADTGPLLAPRGDRKSK
ncbi:MAG TPA: ATP-binding protein [Planctomycetota bacterium]|jgi:two-component system NtrC family sensor kinase